MSRAVAVIIGVCVIGAVAAALWFVMSSANDEQGLRLTPTDTTTAPAPTTRPRQEPTPTTPKDTAPALKLDVSAPKGYTLRTLPTVDGAQRVLLEAADKKQPDVAVRLEPTSKKNLKALRAPFERTARSDEMTAPETSGAAARIAGSPGHLYVMNFPAYTQMRIVAVAHRAGHELVVESAGASSERRAGRAIVKQVASSHITITKG